VMELLQGEDLDHLVRRKGAQRLDVAVWLMIQACSGVADAHRVRVIHRDLKPSNLFLARRAGGPILKVLDFGISRMSEEASVLTRTMTQLGTPQYMSPEQIERPKAVDHRTDIWALGCIFHRLLTAQQVFKGQGVQLVSSVIKNQRKKPSELVPDVPPEVDAIVDRCLAARPEDRFQTVDALTTALRSLSLDDLSDSVPVITPLPADEDTHTTLDVAVEVEHTLALEQNHSGARLVTGATPVSGRLHAPSERTQVMPNSTGPLARSQFSRNTNARSRSMTGAFVVGAVGAITAVSLLAAFTVPRVMANNAKAEAARAGLSLSYTSAHLSWSGVTLADATISDASATATSPSSEPLLRASAIVVPFSGAMHADSAQLAYARRELSLTATDVTMTLSAPTDGTAAVAHFSSPHVNVRYLGVTVDDLRGSLDGTTESATFSLAAAGSSDAALTIAGSWDASGYRASLRVPRQRAGSDSLSLVGFPTTTLQGKAPEVSLVVDVDGDAHGVVRGNAHLLVLGVAASGRSITDLDTEVAFTAKEGALLVDSSKARLGPFALSAQDSRASFSDARALALHLVLDTESVPCADLARAHTDATPTVSGINVGSFFAMSGTAENKGNAHVAMSVDKRGATPLTLTLSFANACNLHAFE